MIRQSICKKCGKNIEGFHTRKYCVSCAKKIIDKRNKIWQKQHSRNSKKFYLYCKNNLGYGRKKFCCNNCKILYIKQQQKDLRIIKNKKKCIICNQEFIAKSKLNICCSNIQCKQKLEKNMIKRSYQSKKLNRKQIINNCKYCGKSFQMKWRKQYKYCSKECKRKQEHIAAQDKKRIQYYNDIEYRIIVGVRTRFKRAVKNESKKKSVLKLIGCTIPELKQYLEKQFKDNMSWDNYGFKGWHIDHIVPCAAFDLTKLEEQEKCFHYTNLQPLWWYENFQKSDKVI